MDAFFTRARMLALVVFSAVIVCGALLPTVCAALSGDEIGKFRSASRSFGKIYDLYDLAMMNAYNLLDEHAFAALEKELDAAVAEKAHRLVKAGKNEADAYAVALGDAVQRAERANTGKLVKGSPREGFYELQSDTLRGHMAVYRGTSQALEEKEEMYSLDFAVWEKDNPAKLGRCRACAAALTDKTVTASVEILDDALEPQNRDPKIQISIAFDGETATVKTTDAFRKGKFLSGSAGSNFEKSAVAIDGKYLRGK
ncbi:MAG: hypothetical protein LBR31_00545 [Desulfovibrio sp.]|jgi:hypothetical protein|nr:hypothetical protein [Desulfovibrio sp.]